MNLFLLIIDISADIINKRNNLKILCEEKKMNKPKPDDRRDNVARIQNNIDHTIANYRETEDMIRNSVDEKQKRELKSKNERRETAINGMKKEIKDEALDKRNGYL